MVSLLLAADATHASDYWNDAPISHKAFQTDRYGHVIDPETNLQIRTSPDGQFRDPSTNLIYRTDNLGLIMRVPDYAHTLRMNQRIQNFKMTMEEVARSRPSGHMVKDIAEALFVDILFCPFRDLRRMGYLTLCEHLCCEKYFRIAYSYALDTSDACAQELHTKLNRFYTGEQARTQTPEIWREALRRMRQIATEERQQQAKRLDNPQGVHSEYHPLETEEIKRIERVQLLKTIASAPKAFYNVAKVSLFLCIFYITLRELLLKFV